MSATTRRLSWSERRLVTPLLRLLAGRLGLDIDQVWVLEVRGRHSGAWHRTPLKVLTHDGRRYLVSLHGAADWAPQPARPPPGAAPAGPTHPAGDRHRAARRPQATGAGAYLAATRRRTARQLLAGGDPRAHDHPVFQLHDNP
jgi:hypothetical protein